MTGIEINSLKKEFQTAVRVGMQIIAQLAAQKEIPVDEILAFQLDALKTAYTECGGKQSTAEQIPTSSVQEACAYLNANFVSDVMETQPE